MEKKTGDNTIGLSFEQALNKDFRTFALSQPTTQILMINIYSLQSFIETTKNSHFHYTVLI